MSMDRLSLEEWHSSSASDSSLDSSGVHLITEEDLLDSLFFTCDVNKNRKVPVSKLIDTLRFTTALANEVSTMTNVIIIVDMRIISMLQRIGLTDACIDKQTS